MIYAEKMQRCHEYVEALEEERRKIQVFQRELPLCLELVTQAIEACKRELSGTTTDYMHGQSECSEQTSSDVPVLEEFIPIKRTHSFSDEDEDNEDDDRDRERKSRKRNRSGVISSNNNNNNNKEKEKSNNSSSTSNNNTNNNNNSSDHKKKSDWLRSVQLWNQSPDPSPRQELPRKAAVTEVKRDGVGGAFQPFQREKSNVKAGTTNQVAATKALPSPVPASATSSTAEPATAAANGGGGNSKKEEKESQNQRKQRRCWSPELHRRFLQALQQLGGSHAATPKQIRELMKVDGLTNDEVKSHLQKYRLHTRRPTSAIHHNSSNPQAPQFVVVGGIWVPPPEYAAVAATSREAATITASNGIYAPLAAPPPTIQQVSTSMAKNPQRTESDHLQSEGRGSHSEGGVHSNSPSTSSSTHTTTNSPEF
ncbi:hypothetical protein Tsubulata_016496 [Turnera subulata]|uniref:HTH myb-type domain-containing protein n=1 Tax=Turnera subulata TaxID=218843 RepID=A0A9Q0JGZ2_9ROSI|nr:hypothetical protein Tsubulata_016496 [Turnera subulata]